jgi:hypothetical protein
MLTSMRGTVVGVSVPYGLGLLFIRDLVLMCSATIWSRLLLTLTRTLDGPLYLTLLSSGRLIRTPTGRGCVCAVTVRQRIDRPLDLPQLGARVFILLLLTSSSLTSLRSALSGLICGSLRRVALLLLHCNLVLTLPDVLAALGLTLIRALLRLLRMSLLLGQAHLILVTLYLHRVEPPLLLRLIVPLTLRLDRSHRVHNIHHIHWAFREGTLLWLLLLLRLGFRLLDLDWILLAGLRLFIPGRVKLSTPDMSLLDLLYNMLDHNIGSL